MSDVISRGYKLPSLLNDGGILVCEYEEGSVDCSLELCTQTRPQAHFILFPHPL